MEETDPCHCLTITKTTAMSGQVVMWWGVLKQTYEIKKSMSGNIRGRYFVSHFKVLFFFSKYEMQFGLRCTYDAMCIRISMCRIIP